MMLQHNLQTRIPTATNTQTASDPIELGEEARIEGEVMIEDQERRGLNREASELASTK